MVVSVAPVMAMPAPVLPLTTLPSGGRVKVGVTSPLLPVGLFTAPVTPSTETVPPRVLLTEAPVTSMPFAPLGAAAVPAGLVPIRLATTTLPEDPSMTRPLPPLLEMTLENQAEELSGFVPMVDPSEPAMRCTPAPALGALAPLMVRPT